MAVAAGDPDRLPVAPDDMLATYDPAHGMVGEVLLRFRWLASAHPLATYSERVAPAGAGRRVPRTTIRCTGDGPTAPMPDGESVIERPTGHWPMLTAPAALAPLLAGLAT